MTPAPSHLVNKFTKRFNVCMKIEEVIMTLYIHLTYAKSCYYNDKNENTLVTINCLFAKPINNSQNILPVLPVKISFILLYNKIN